MSTFLNRPLPEVYVQFFWGSTSRASNFHPSKPPPPQCYDHGCFRCDRGQLVFFGSGCQGCFRCLALEMLWVDIPGCSHFKAFDFVSVDEPFLLMIILDLLERQTPMQRQRERAKKLGFLQQLTWIKLCSMLSGTWIMWYSNQPLIKWW